MGLFDMFKKKEPTFEALLKKSAFEPAYRIDIYARILSEKFFVLTEEGMFPQGSFITNGNTKAQVRTLNNGSVPVFTSTDRIFDRGIIKTEVCFLELEGKDLLKMLIGKTLIINPYSDFAKEILPSEIEQILDGSILT
ncbi:SseB family protein [Mucilaginibacter sp.]|uniref:SseB family protein n=1 Tax=Mucilaginibacter sp. TaxID=1882438 RepID=UPI0025D3700E|nr:SseB family protein [Mucilaginibacter sp.]